MESPYTHDDKERGDHIEIANDPAMHGSQDTGVQGHLDPEAVGPDAPGDLPGNYFMSYRFLGTFAAASFNYASGFMGYTMSANIITIINKDLGTSGNYAWALTVFLLAQTAVVAPLGRLSDIFGRRWVLIACCTLAFIGWIVCGTAKTTNTLIGGSVIAAVGTIVQQYMMVQIGELVPKSHRSFLVAGTIIFIAPLAAIAPGIARTFVDHATWRWVYYLPAIFSAVGTLLLWLCYFPPTFQQLNMGESKTRVFKGFDYLGLVLMAGGSVSFLLGVSWGGQVYAWKSAQTITPIVVGGLALVAFFIWEATVKVSHPMIPLRLFKSRNFVCLLIVSSVGAINILSLSITWPQQIELIYNKSVTATGWMSCTLSAGAVVGIIFGGFAKPVSKFVSIKWQLVISCILFTTFSGAMGAVLPPNEGRALAFSIVSSIAMGYMENVSLTSVPLTVNDEDLGISNGTQSALRNLVSAAASAIYVTVLGNKIQSNISNILIPTLVGAGLPISSVSSMIQDIQAGNTSGLANIPGVTPAIIQLAGSALQKVYGNSFQTIDLISIAYGSCAIIAALCIDEKALASSMTPQIARRMQGFERRPSVSDKKVGSPWMVKALAIHPRHPSTL